MLAAQGNLTEALKWYRSGLDVADRLVKTNPENAGWQHNLSVSYSKVGDVLMAQGNLAEALKSYRDGLALPTAWPSPTPKMPFGSAISPFYTTRSAMCWRQETISPRR